MTRTQTASEQSTKKTIQTTNARKQTKTRKSKTNRIPPSWKTGLNTTLSRGSHDKKYGKNTGTYPEPEPKIQKEYYFVVVLIHYSRVNIKQNSSSSPYMLLLYRVSSTRSNLSTVFKNVISIHEVWKQTRSSQWFKTTDAKFPEKQSCNAFKCEIWLTN